VKTALLAAVLTLSLASAAAALEVQPVTDGVWALVGEKQQRSPTNLGNNSTFGVVVTSDGVVLVDPGGSRKGAEAIHDAIRTITDKPVKYVIDTGGQDHRWLGNGYWQDLGATVIASKQADADQHARAGLQLTMLSSLLGDALAGTEPAYADVTFDGTYAFDLGGVHFQVIHAGPAHTPGDSFVWLAQKKTVFSGDVVFTERLLGVLEDSSIAGWPKAFEAMAALAPEHVVPGHGHATTLKRATADTYDYLMNLRRKMAAYIEGGGDIIGSVKVDQSAFSYLEQFDSLSRRNAQTAFQQMEWE